MAKQYVDLFQYNKANGWFFFKFGGKLSSTHESNSVFGSVSSRL